MFLPFLPQEYTAFQGGIHRYTTQTQQVMIFFPQARLNFFLLERKSEAVKDFSLKFKAKKVEFAGEREFKFKNSFT